MKKFKPLFLLIPIIGLAVACQPYATPLMKGNQNASTATQVVSMRLQSNSPSPAISIAQFTDTPAPSAYVIPTATPSYIQTSTSTVILPSPTQVTTDLPQDLQQEIFEDLWNVINQEYLYPDFNGINWMETYADYYDLVEDGMTSDEFYYYMDEMISRLGDDHSKFLNPNEAELEDAEYRGSLDYVGVGILVSANPERGHAVILAVFPDSPAEISGLKPRDSLITANGQSIVDQHGNLQDVIRGPEGSLVSLVVQSPEEEPREVILTRKRITGTIPVSYTVLETSSDARIGYIHLVTFTDGSVDNQLHNALLDMTTSVPLDGLIIDNRQNGGGADTVMTPILSYFTSGTLGYYVNRDGRYPLKIDQGEDINGSMSIPLVLLIGRDTVSYGEVFAGILKDKERAYLIGETTEGNIETLWGYDFADGSRAWIAHDTFVPFNNPEENWELTGIIPDLFIEGDWEDFTMENDPVILAAVAYLENLETE